MASEDQPNVAPEEQLAFEARQRGRQTACTVAAAVLLMVASIIGLLGPHSPVSEETLDLITEHHRQGYDIVATILNSVAELAFGVTLWYLWRCARARASRPLAYIPVLVAIGVLIAAITGVVYVFAFTHIASEFVSSGAQTYDQANHLQSSTVIALCKILGQLGALLIAVSFVLVSLQAMRVGLLPKFMGYVGMLAGALFLFPITAVPVVEFFWLLALGVLFAGRWPNAQPAAWRTGRAEAWPSGAEMRARRMAEAEAAREQRAARKRGDHRRKVSDAPSSEPAAASAPAATPSAGASARKRKRKRKH